MNVFEEGLKISLEAFFLPSFVSSNASCQNLKNKQKNGKTFKNIS